MSEEAEYEAAGLQLGVSHYFVLSSFLFAIVCCSFSRALNVFLISGIAFSWIWLSMFSTLKIYPSMTFFSIFYALPQVCQSESIRKEGLRTSRSARNCALHFIQLLTTWSYARPTAYWRIDASRMCNCSARKHRVVYSGNNSLSSSSHFMDCVGMSPN